jgi:hypothetical protein
MQNTLFDLFHSLGLIVVSGFHASELLVTFLVALAFLTMAVMGREHEESEAASLEDHGRGWLPRLH